MGVRRQNKTEAKASSCYLKVTLHLNNVCCLIVQFSVLSFFKERPELLFLFIRAYAITVGSLFHMKSMFIISLFLYFHDMRPTTWNIERVVYPTRTINIKNEFYRRILCHNFNFEIDFCRVCKAPAMKARIHIPGPHMNFFIFVSWIFHAYLLVVLFIFL